MSDVSYALGGAIATFGPIIEDALSDYAMFSSPIRNIGGIFPHVTVEELHRDEMMITQHPVEQGAPPTDHAFMQPYTVEIRCGWSNSTAGAEGYVQAVYQELLALQKSAQPFSVDTGKRSYPQMLFRSLMVRTDETSEFSLMVVGLLQQYQTTSTQQAPSTPNSDGSSAVASGTGAIFTPSGVVPPTTQTTIGSGDVQAYGFLNSPYSAGTIQLQSAPSGPSLSSITGFGGVP